ncbi:MAG TPA: winged helix DNA-binding domain-containing protein [Candidatus Dormibacteraeota bacterium]|nr:winged helix DNA-binding domain-containing protein [Candidatus Dormibacteraeota bacterium]
MTTPFRLDEDDAVGLVMHKHHLLRDQREAGVLSVTDDLVGLHATSAVSPFLQLRARIRDFQPAQLDAVLDAGRAARVPCMRNTLFIESADHVPVVLAATRRLKEQGRGRYLAANGLTPRLYERLAERVDGALRGKARDVRELQAALKVKVSLSPVVILMCDDARLVRWKGPGGWRGGRPTYRRFEEVIPGPVEEWDEPAALSKLVDWYVRRYGPVTEEDIVWWTGLPVGLIREAVTSSGMLVAARVGSSKRDFLIHERDLAHLQRQPRPSAEHLSLLPVLDPYLQGYRHRERSIDRRHERLVVDRGGNVTSVILVAGRVAGVWDFIDGATPEVRLFFFERQTRVTRRRVHALAAEIGEFLSQRLVRSVEVDAMRPLIDRRAGAVVSPLRDGA